jgi:hypothetical protein
VKQIIRQPWTFWYEWSITAILIVGAVLTSFNVYPLNIWFLFVSNLGWAAQAIMWKKYSLFTVQTVITIIYFPPVIKSIVP